MRQNKSDISNIIFPVIIGVVVLLAVTGYFVWQQKLISDSTVSALTREYLLLKKKFIPVDSRSQTGASSARPATNQAALKDIDSKLNALDKQGAELDKPDQPIDVMSE